MRGVDKHDWLIGKYSVGIRGKKWYWPLFIRILDMSMVNAWTIYKFVTANDDKEILSLLDFQETSLYIISERSRSQRDNW